LIFDERTNGQAVMHYSRHCFTASVITRRTRQPMTNKKLSWPEHLVVHQRCFKMSLGTRNMEKTQQGHLTRVLIFYLFILSSTDLVVAILWRCHNNI